VTSLRRRLAAADRGFTLVELLVAMMLLTIVVGLSTGSLISAIDQQSNLTQSTEAQSRNQVGMEMFSRLLRQATYPEQGTAANSTIISVADTNKIVFTTRPSSTTSAASTSISTPVRQYTFQLVGTNLQWGGADKTACASGSPCTYGTPTLHTLVPGVRNAQGSSVCPANTGDGAVFHYAYFNSTGALVDATVPSGGLTTATTPALKDVVYVRIELYTQTQTGPKKPACMPMTDSVQLRNHP
jgi:prepilin-type N-terminal cleavage/methylation domain-containing protein